MSIFLAMKSRRKVAIVVGAVVVLTAFMLMPGQWHERMATIGSYEEDSSAMGRINAWWMAWNLAKDRFPIGGGFAIYEPDVFARYAPNPIDLHAAHSIYFQVIGEHGFVGLFLFLLVFLLAWRAGSWTIRNTRGIPELSWASDLAGMLQASLVGFAIGGAFLSLTYFDLPYYIAVMLIVTRDLVKSDVAGRHLAKDRSNRSTISAWQPTVNKPGRA